MGHEILYFFYIIELLILRSTCLLISTYFVLLYNNMLFLQAYNLDITKANPVSLYENHDYLAYAYTVQISQNV